MGKLTNWRRFEGGLLRDALKGEAKMGQRLTQLYEKYVGSHKNYGGFINNSTMNFMVLYKEGLNA